MELGRIENGGMLFRMWGLRGCKGINRKMKERSELDLLGWEVLGCREERGRDMYVVLGSGWWGKR